MSSATRAKPASPALRDRQGREKIYVHLRASACPVGPEDRTGAVKFKMNKNLSDIVKVTAAILVKDNKIIIAKRR